MFEMGADRANSPESIIQARHEARERGRTIGDAPMANWYMVIDEHGQESQQYTDILKALDALKLSRMYSFVVTDSNVVMAKRVPALNGSEVRMKGAIERWIRIRVREANAVSDERGATGIQQGLSPEESGQAKQEEPRDTTIANAGPSIPTTVSSPTVREDAGLEKEEQGLLPSQRS